jgi:hypothetical protein
MKRSMSRAAKFLSILLSIVIIFIAVPIPALASASDDFPGVIFDSTHNMGLRATDVNITSSTTEYFYGSSTLHCVSVSGDNTHASLYFIDCNLDLHEYYRTETAGNFSAVNVIGNASVDIYIKGKCNFTGANNYPGIYKSSGTGTLNIYVYSGATLNANGGMYGAGIGGKGSVTDNPDPHNTKNISIGGSYYNATGVKLDYGGVINATGGINGAGIGGGSSGTADNINIKSGIITANGGHSGAGIGGGNGGEGNNITISGGTVTATGAISGAGIGGGRLYGANNITISGGNVTAKGGSPGTTAADAGGAGIGTAGGGYTNGTTFRPVCKNVSISNATVNAIAGINAAAIGGGAAGTSDGITIGGTRTDVTATCTQLDSATNALLGNGSTGRKAKNIYVQCPTDLPTEKYGAYITFRYSATSSSPASSSIYSGDCKTGEKVDIYTNEIYPKNVVGLHVEIRPLAPMVKLLATSNLSIDTASDKKLICHGTLYFIVEDNSGSGVAMVTDLQFDSGYGTGLPNVSIVKPSLINGVNVYSIPADNKYHEIQALNKAGVEGNITDIYLQKTFPVTATVDGIPVTGLVNSAGEAADYLDAGSSGTLTIKKTPTKGKSFTGTFNGTDMIMQADGSFTCSYTNIQGPSVIAFISHDDTTPPTGSISVRMSGHAPGATWTSSVMTDTRTFYFGNDTEFTLSGSDTQSGLNSMAYYFSDKVLSASELKSVNWVSCTGSAVLSPDKSGYLYGRFTDGALNDTYVVTAKLVLDKTGPVISVASSPLRAVVTVTDTSPIKRVEINGQVVTPGTDGKYVIARANGSQRVTAYDNLDNISSQNFTFPNDTTKPTGSISIQSNSWASLLNKLTFGLFFKDSQVVTMKASDNIESADGYTSQYAPKIEYLKYAKDTALTESQLTAANGWLPYTAPLRLYPDQKLSIYARITDWAGNITYINTNGIILDSVTPVVNIDTGGYTSGSWTTKDVVLTASNTANNLSPTAMEYKVGTGAWQTYTGPISITSDTNGTLYTFRCTSAAGVTSAEKSVTVKRDAAFPSGDITFDGKSVKDTSINLSAVPTPLLYNNDVTVGLTGSDSGSGIAGIEYILSAKALSNTELKAATNWSNYASAFKAAATDGQGLYCYSKVTDKAGNSVIISSKAAAFDLTAPVIDGITPGGTYYTTRTVNVTDSNLSSVTLGGKASQSPLTLEGNRDATYTVVATDGAGNVTTAEVTMKPIASIIEKVKDVNKDNVNPADRQNLLDAKAKLEALLKDENSGITQAEKDEINGYLDTINAAIAKLDFKSPKTGGAGSALLITALAALSGGTLSGGFIAVKKKRRQHDGE